MRASNSSEADFHEDERLAALADYGVLDTPPERDFEDIVLLASEVCGTPIALVSFVARGRQWFKARVGLAVCETPIEQSVCLHALGQHEILVIPDLTKDDRTKGNTLVTQEPHIRFYAGAPLITPTGTAIGTLCVIDQTPRPEGLTAAKGKALEALARQVMTSLEHRRVRRAQERTIAKHRRTGEVSMARAMASDEVGAMLRASDMRSRLAQEAGGIGTFDVDMKSDEMIVSAEFCRVFGLPIAKTYPAGTIEALTVGDDRNLPPGAEEKNGDATIEEVEIRIARADSGQHRWIARRAELSYGEHGEVARMIGTVEDVTDRKLANARQAALLLLGDRLRATSSVKAIVDIAAESLGRTLRASRAGYSAIDIPGEEILVERDWTADSVASIAGRYPLSTFWATIERLKLGDTIAAANLPEASWLASDAAGYAAVGAMAQIQVPLMANGQLVGVLFVHDVEARIWTKEEIDFARSVADRTYAALAKVRAEHEQRLLNEELSHRLKNTLAMVQAIATQTLAKISDREAIESFEKRILALSKAHDVLLQQSWSAARIRSVVHQVLTLHDDTTRFMITGPDINLGPKAALSLSLLLHELATNAVKHGGLSSPSGRVDFSWNVDGDARDPVLHLKWFERGGPEAQTPTIKGFGNRLIQMGLSGTGSVERRYTKLGFEAEFRAPLALVQQN